MQRQFLLKIAAFSAVVSMLAGCAGLPHPAQSLTRYDLGPAPLSDAQRQALPALALAPMQVPVTAASNTAVHYRLAYADAQVLYAYSQARWSSAPASIVEQRLREHLSQGGRSIVLSADAGELPPTVRGRQVPVLRMVLEDFTHVFSSEVHSMGSVRVRATLVEPTAQGDRLLAQQVFMAQESADTPDVQAGVRALTKGVDAIGAQLVQWLVQVQTGNRG